MNDSTRLAGWHRDVNAMVAGSVYAAPPGERTDTARALVSAGLDVHVDVMAPDEGLPAGVSLTELAEIAGAVAPARVDVHLIGSADFVASALPGVLHVRPGKVFLPWAAFTEARAGAVRERGAGAWITLWCEWSGVSRLQFPAAPDGVLVMLIEPGSTARASLERLKLVAACAAELPVIVDGGVTEEIAPLCVTAGAESLVVGRALLPAAADRAQSERNLT